MAVTVLDSSVLIAFLDADDPHHEKAVLTLATNRQLELTTPASAYSEVLVYPYRTSAAEGARIERFFEEVPIRVEPVGVELGRRAARLRARHRRLRLPDALVIAAGDLLEARDVLTFDARWRGVSRRVRVVA